MISLYKLIAEGGEFQVKSTQFKHQRATINDEATQRIADALALELQMLYDSDPYLNQNADLDKTYGRYDLELIRDHIDIDGIYDGVTIGIENYEDEADLDLFYYLADNAISWPKNITLTKRYLFLYRLAKFFKHVDESEYDKTIEISTSKEIVDGIKYRIKQMSKRDKDGELLELYFGDDM